ncbi:MAG: hypothetical protein ACRDOL_38745 [Streptosporangiaceae bacterium]
MTSSNSSVPAPAGTCQCPPGAQATAGQVTMTGHQDRCPNAVPRVYTWLDGEQRCTGTLADYAASFAVDRDESLPGGDLATAIRDTSQGTLHMVRAVCLEDAPDRDGCWQVRLSVPGEQVTVAVWALSQPFPPDGDDAEPAPAVPADMHRWLWQAARTSPWVQVEQDPDSDGTRIVAVRLTEAGVTAEVDTGQVFLITAAEMTTPTGHPARQHTLNPAGQRSVHADLDGGPLCGLMTAAETVTSQWPAVTCLDCKAAEPGGDLAALDELDRAMAEREAHNEVIAASPQPLPLYAIMRRVSPQYRAAVPAALDSLARRGALAATTPPDGPKLWAWQHH